MNNHMFSLEQSIADWRRQMLTAGIKTPVPLEELEIHLREEVERQMKAGANEQKAFEISALRIGQAKMLDSEFKKSERTFMKKTSIIAAVIGTLCAAFATFVYWQALAVIAAVGYPVRTNDKLIWCSLCAAVFFWTVAGYGFISRRKHGHDHAA
jgi:hypothetical protein